MSSPVVVAALAMALGLAGVPRSALAIPRLDLSTYPAPAAGERRWVIQLPGVLPPTHDPALSPNPRDWRVQLIIGQMAQVDCNMHSFAGRLRPWRARDRDGAAVVFRVENVGALASTRKGCPPGEPKRRAFVAMAGKPFVVPYNASLPIVVIAPAALELRWRLWKAERDTRDALAL